MSYLKTKTVQFSIGELEIKELSAQAQIEIMEAADKRFEGIFLACKYGAWPDKSTDELKQMLSLRHANEISAAVFQLSGVETEVKKDSTDPGEGSSSS